MDIGFEQNGWAHLRPDAGTGEHETVLFDWHGLRARFLAAQACRLATGGESAMAAHAIGSVMGGAFDPLAARAVAALGHCESDEQGAVNRVVSADGKDIGANAVALPAYPWPVDGECDD